MPGFEHRLAGPDGAILVYTLPASLNHTTADQVRDEARRLLPNRDDAGLVLDCAEVALITSIGIAALLQIQEHCDDVRAPMALAAVSAPIRQMLRMVRLDGRFKQADSVDEAVEGIERGR